MNILDEQAMEALRDIDKRTADFSLRIPEITKSLIDRLPKPVKSRLNDCLLLTIDRILHEANYVPGRNLKSGDE